MSTGDQYYISKDKKILNLTDLKDHILGYATGLINDCVRTTYPDDGSFDSKHDFAATQTDRFDLDASKESTDAHGHIMELTSALGTGIYFENTSAIVYDVGLRYNEQPSGVRINPRTGLPEYEYWKETVGEKDDPDAVVDDGDATITLTVDSVCESGVSNVGRKCLVYLKTINKNATTESIAIEELTVTWDGSNNKIATTGNLGQTTISTTVTDYEVILLGPTVSRNIDLSATGNHFFVGEITGAGIGVIPSVWDITGQTLIVPNTMDLGDITRTHSGHLKVSVQAQSGETDEAQIEVVDTGSSTVFKVDEDGQVTSKEIVATAAETDGIGIKGNGDGSGNGVFGENTDAVGGAGVYGKGNVGILGDSIATGAGVHGRGGTGAHGVIAESDTTSPIVSAFSITPQDATPTGPNTIGDICVVSGKLYICTTAGTPGDFTVVGNQT